MADQITPQDFADLTDFLYTGGPFQGYDAWGYIGDRNRNYLTDAMVIEGANALGWSLAELTAWMQSAHGRHTLDRRPQNAREMWGLMACIDAGALLEDVLTDLER